MRCECGCGYAGLDDLTQFCIEEACFVRLSFVEAKLHEAPPEDNLLALHAPKALSPHEQLGARHQTLMQEAQE